MASLCNSVRGAVAEEKHYGQPRSTKLTTYLWGVMTLRLTYSGVWVNYRSFSKVRWVTKSSKMAAHALNRGGRTAKSDPARLHWTAHKP